MLAEKIMLGLEDNIWSLVQVVWGANYWSFSGTDYKASVYTNLGMAAATNNMNYEGKKSLLFSYLAYLWKDK